MRRFQLYIILSIGMFLGCLACDPAKEQSTVNQAQATDSTFSDSSKATLEDTALIDYSPSSTFVDEEGEGSPSK